MNRIEQTTLSIEDINEHWEFLLPMLRAEEKLLHNHCHKDYDDMLERFIHTFLEDYEPESR